MAYLYRHIRLDKNEPFYIGIGDDSEGKYKRAKATWGRNKIWKLITTKTPYKVEVMLDDILWSEACEKEKFFISYYGKKCLNKGLLCNITDGGDGTVGYKRSKQLNQDALLYRAIPIYQYDLEGNFVKEWNSTAEAANNLNMDRGHICNVLKEKNTYVKGFVFKYEKYDKIKPVIKYKIFQYSKTNFFIKEWNSIKEAEEILNISGSNISKSLKESFRTAGGFKWYKTKQYV